MRSINWKKMFLKSICKIQNFEVSCIGVFRCAVLLFGYIFQYSCKLLIHCKLLNPLFSHKVGSILYDAHAFLFLPKHGQDELENTEVLLETQ